MRVRVKASSTIKPAEPTPKHRLWVSDLDLIQPVTHAPTVYFYKANTSNTTTTFFSPYIMKNSLSQTLVHFYPLTGRLLYDESRRLEIDCNEAGIIFYEAESDVEIDDFGDFKPTPELRNLAPHIDYTTDITEWPLLLVQLTVFRCGGISLGLATSHTAMDGQSASHFVSTWAKIARSGTSNVCVPPFMDRTLLRARDPPVEPAFNHEEFKPPPRLLDQEGGGGGEEERKEETVVKMFKFNAQQSGSHTLGCTQRGRFYGSPNLVLTSWLGMSFYDADFGWGPPMYMGPAALGFEGKGFILPTKEDDGGMIVALRLHSKHMENLKELLSDHAH
ncbi:hypothetical protein MRB53_013501 [Persea americana]|uniref:Uncharacterized protein n=1 Tax=Persea americana TaxID=3435 RepID=A0ACC2K898_PERAE|nr:hypothetical protein MRB53_013501 [Persea americana]